MTKGKRDVNNSAEQFWMKITGEVERNADVERHRGSGSRSRTSKQILSCYKLTADSESWLDFCTEREERSQTHWCFVPRHFNDDCMISLYNEFVVATTSRQSHLPPVFYLLHSPILRIAFFTKKDRVCHYDKKCYPLYKCLCVISWNIL